MYTNILVLDDGTEIQANQTGSTITNLVYTATVSSTTDLCPGAACTAKIEFTVWVQPGSTLAFTSGTRVKYYQKDAGGSRTLVGTFWAVKPTKQTRNSYKVYAYDAVSKLDGIQSTWLRSIQDSFPMSLWAFAQAVAQQCGVTLSNSSLPRSGSYQVQAFYGDNLTGRQLLGWVAQASCTFLRATPSGGIEFAWYTTNTQMRISPDGQPVNGVQAVAYRDGGLSYEDYQTATIDKVQIKQSDDDVGVIYPANETGTNALVIKGNLLLTTSSAELLQPVAQSIYTAMQGITYTPLKVSLFSNGVTFAPGQIVTVKDPQGNTLQTYVMTVQQSGAKISLESTGNASRDGTAAVNEEKLNLNGKILEISATVDGLTIKASELSGDYTELKQTMDEFSLTVVTDGNIRSKFAADDTSVTIESGVITFASNTLVVDSDNFRLDRQGNVTITGSFYSNASNGNQMSLTNGLAAFYARDSAGKSYLTTLISRTAESNPCGVVDVYGRSNTGAVNTQVRLQGGLTDGSIHLYSAFGTEQAVITSGEGNVSWLAGGLDVRGQHGVQAYYGSIGRLQITELGVNGGAIQKVYWKWDGNLGAYVLSTSR